MFTEEEKQRIVASIQDAERNTSGEVKVHVERHCTSEPIQRAKEVFIQLEMNRTQLHNGVLFYIALEDHKFAILGDSGIDAVVPADFWENIKEMMRALFRQGKIADGLVAGIEQAGQQLKSHFPYQSNDVNELSDDISFGE